MNDLRDRLTSAVPEPPDLTGLASRAEAAGRARRTRRRAALAGGAALLVAGVVAAPALLDGGTADGDRVADEPAATLPQRDDSRCPGPGDHADLATGDVVSVRFCSVENYRGVAASFTVVTGEAAGRLVDQWRAMAAPEPVCEGYSNRPFRIEVTFADGTATHLDGDTGTCSVQAGGLRLGDPAAIYADLAHAEAATLAATYDDAPVPEVDCPDRLTAAETNADGASAADLPKPDPGDAATTSVLTLPAVTGTVCRLVGGDWQEHEIDAGLAERLRIVVNGSNAYGAMADCSTTPTDPAYVVSLADRTGTRRSFTVDVRDCSPVQAALGTPAVDVWLGLASAALGDALQEIG